MRNVYIRGIQWIDEGNEHRPNRYRGVTVVGIYDVWEAPNGKVFLSMPRRHDEPADHASTTLVTDDIDVALGLAERDYVDRIASTLEDEPTDDWDD